MQNDGRARCGHGHPAEIRVDAGGWHQLFALDKCKKCPAGEPCGIKYKPGEPPKRKKVEEAVVPEPEPLVDPDHCTVCREFIPKGAAVVPVKGGGFRHVVGSPACDRPLASDSLSIKLTPATESDETCPTCGRPVVEGAPADSKALRQALLDGLAALDVMEAAQAAQEDDDR